MLGRPAMGVLLWTLPVVFPMVLSARIQPPKPVNATVISGQFSHILKWEPGPGTPAEACYRVTIKTQRGTSEQPVAGCECVQYPLMCNLTMAVSDPVQVYIPEVRALLHAEASEAALASRFKPISHMGLPVVTVSACGRDLCVGLQPPMEDLRRIYDLFSYKLQIKSNDEEDAKILRTFRSLRGQTLEYLAPGRQYCVSVSLDDRLEDLKSNFSTPVCALTPNVDVPGFAAPFIFVLVGLLLLAAGVTVLLLVLTGSICLRKKPLPSVLASIHHTDEELIISPWTVSLSSNLSVTSIVHRLTEKMTGLWSPDHSDEESATESSGQSPEGGYQHHLRTTNLLLHSSSSAPLSTTSQLMASFFPSQQSDFISSVSMIHPSGGTSLSAGSTHKLSRDTAQSCHTVISVTGRCEDDEEETVGVEEDSQDVNLHTLKFGRFENVEKESLHVTSLEEDCVGLTDVCGAPPVLLSHSWGSVEATADGVSWNTDEEEEREAMNSSCGYMGRDQAISLNSGL